MGNTSCGTWGTPGPHPVVLGGACGARDCTWSTYLLSLVLGLLIWVFKAHVSTYMRVTPKDSRNKDQEVWSIVGSLPQMEVSRWARLGLRRDLCDSDSWKWSLWTWTECWKAVKEHMWEHNNLSVPILQTVIPGDQQRNLIHRSTTWMSSSVKPLFIYLDFEATPSCAQGALVVVLHGPHGCYG